MFTEDEVVRDVLEGMDISSADPSANKLDALVRAVIEWASRKEREACAKIADTCAGRPNVDDDQKYIGECIASAIRARNN